MKKRKQPRRMNRSSQNRRIMELELVSTRIGAKMAVLAGIVREMSSNCNFDDDSVQSANATTR